MSGLISDWDLFRNKRIPLQTVAYIINVIQLVILASDSKSKRPDPIMLMTPHTKAALSGTWVVGDKDARESNKWPSRAIAYTIRGVPIVLERTLEIQTVAATRETTKYMRVSPWNRNANATGA